MAQHSHPSNRRERISERQKALNLIKELKKREKNGHWEKVENGVQNLHKFVEHGTDI